MSADGAPRQSLSPLLSPSPLRCRSRSSPPLFSPRRWSSRVRRRRCCSRWFSQTVVAAAPSFKSDAACSLGAGRSVVRV
nr:hypothetical protein Iba_chr09eCG7620 [Ipomoea batatas]